MIIIPQQYFGLGDCIFIQSLLQQLTGVGDKVLYPIMPSFVHGCNRAYPDTTFIDYRLLNVDYQLHQERVDENIRILPVRFADQILKKPYSEVMKAKYDLYGLDWQSWRDAMYTRNHAKEVELFNMVVGTSPKYNLISPTFGSEFRYNLNISTNNGLPDVYLSHYAGFSMFDWSMVIEQASTIHAASSSILYLLELLKLQATEVHLYSRKPIEPHFRNVDYLFTKDYILHE